MPGLRHKNLREGPAVEVFAVRARDCSLPPCPPVDYDFLMPAHSWRDACMKVSLLLFLEGIEHRSLAKVPAETR